MGKVFKSVEEIQLDNVRFIDARFDLQDNEAGKRAFEESHAPGAIYLDLEQDLSDMTSENGRHPMPSKAKLADLFQSVGLRYEDTIVVYDQGAAPFATRAWWMLTYAGFPHVVIVNGGAAALATKVDFTADVVNYAPTAIDFVWRDELYAPREAVKAIVDGEVQATLLDARAAARYRGEVEPLDKIAGHIPTAKNFDWEQLKGDGTLQANEALRQKVAQDEHVVVYCGSGVTASPLYAVLADEGYEHIQLYVGSYSDWITQYAIETGTNE
ncbi:sulfurtransferase [Lysinibacillus piscis]|uniref:Thiosulfate sulfurtransferase n=1 Tax=Lysinibacillus piscis TaxID=2518931 RepID=A0ABQ5NFQ4_9BACI|nr:sulfurtransferase [Lysinibacillus sp. KH24]GLC86943.1 thiosulfate sulfurtransferase [Lysinibacillus sp. KH24]